MAFTAEHAESAEKFLSSKMESCLWLPGCGPLRTLRARRRKASEELELLIESLHRPFGHERAPLAAVGARQFVFFFESSD